MWHQSGPERWQRVAGDIERVPWMTSLRETKDMQRNTRFPKHSADHIAPTLQLTVSPPRGNHEIGRHGRFNNRRIVARPYGIFRPSKSTGISGTKRKDVGRYERAEPPCLGKTHTASVRGIELECISRRRIQHEKIHDRQRVVPGACQQVPVNAIVTERR